MMNTNLITLRFSPEDLDALRSHLLTASNYYFVISRRNNDPEHEEKLIGWINSARHLHDATLYAQYPDDPSKRPPTQKEILAWQQKSREHWLPILERRSTQELLNYRVGCYRTHGGDPDRDPWDIGYDITGNHGPNCPLALIKEVLATREHIPNKEERQEARRQKAKAGRQRGRRDR